MAKIYFTHSFPMGGTDQEQINLIVERAKAGGLPNVRVMTWESTFNVVPRLENVASQVADAGFGVDVLYFLDNKKISEARMRELCTITRAETIFIHPGGTWGEWGTPIDWLKTFNRTAKTYGHTFGYFGGGGGLAYVEPLTMLRDTGIIAETYFAPTMKPPRETYKEPYSNNWRLRWAYPYMSSQFWKWEYGHTSAEIKSVVDGVKSFLIADGTFTNLRKVSLILASTREEQYVKPEQAEGVTYLNKELGALVPPPIERLPLALAAAGAIIGGVVGGIYKPIGPIVSPLIGALGGAGLGYGTGAVMMHRPQHSCPVCGSEVADKPLGEDVLCPSCGFVSTWTR